MDFIFYFKIPVLVAVARPVPIATARVAPVPAAPKAAIIVPVLAANKFYQNGRKKKKLLYSIK